MKLWTGERLEPHIINITTVEHLHRYALAQELVRGRRVLDIASGEGYGSYLMSISAKSVIGVDIDSAVIKNASIKYKKDNLEFKHGSADNIPLENSSIDIVISFETLEHHDKHHEMFLEIKRVLKSDGILIMSSPDRKYYSDEPKYSNPFHIKELYQSEFKTLVNQYFQYSFYYNQRALSGSLILSESENNEMNIYRGSFEYLSQPINFTPVYNLVIASDIQTPKLKSSIFSTSDLIEEVKKEFTELYTNTLTWKIGRFIIAPLTLIKKIFKNNG